MMKLEIIFLQCMAAYFPNIKMDDHVLAVQVQHCHLSVAVMHHCTVSQLKTIMWFIIFQARVHYFS